MIYTRPFITKHFIAYEGDSRASDVVLVVQVLDSVTQRFPVVRLRVRLKELPAIRPILSNNSFHCFQKRPIEILDGRPTTDEIPPGNYTLIIEPDPTSANQYFLEPRQPADPWTTSFERPIVLPAPVPFHPLRVDVHLSPTPAYPFPANATLVRGRVFRAGVEVPTAEVSTDYNEVDSIDPTQLNPVHVRTITDRNGEYVLFFQRLPAKTQNITVTAAKNGPPRTTAVTITEGKTRTRQNINLP
jgi:hypothetical protein